MAFSEVAQTQAAASDAVGVAPEAVLPSRIQSSRPQTDVLVWSLPPTQGRRSLLPQVRAYHEILPQPGSATPCPGGAALMCAESSLLVVIGAKTRAALGHDSGLDDGIQR